MHVEHFYKYMLIIVKVRCFIDGIISERKLLRITFYSFAGLGNCNGRSLWFQVFTPDKVFVYYFGLETNCTVSVSYLNNLSFKALHYVMGSITHLKLCLTIVTHNFKWLKITLVIF